FDAEGRRRFRNVNGLVDKFVVMYAGNHSPCHPLDTLLQTARRLSEREDIVFCFVGGGSEFERVKKFAEREMASNIRCLDYQPLEQLAALLSAADLQAVVMGNPFVGLVHPCKIYNILAVGSPVLYIGPGMSHVADLFTEARYEEFATTVAHGDVDAAV